MLRPLFLDFPTRAKSFTQRQAICAPEASYPYQALLDTSHNIASALLAGQPDLGQSRVAFHIPPGFTHIAVQWAIWRAGAVAVPLALSHPQPELDYVVRDAEASIIIADGDGELACRTIATNTGARFALARDLIATTKRTELPSITPDRRAIIIYTSGTTGRPKGVVSTHANIAAQISALVSAWEWRETDRILLVLPLHHVHGVINVVGCALWSGATCEILPAFDADAAWDVIIAKRLTLFMAVPTIYRRLIAAYDAADPERRSAMRAGCEAMRLMVSGSAALPVQTLERWREITGHTLLERYGMTEIGMALSNPLHGTRRAGFVGAPLPGVEVRVVTELGALVPDGTAGELEVRGPNVFHEYWRRPDATRDAFRDGWFRTGDTAVLDNGSYRLLGRSSVDILKTGGYKVSALEIEEVLREHPAVAECAVVGVEDPEWGDRVSVAVELRAGVTLSLDELKAWTKDRLAPYKVPRDLRVVATLPRNAMGKVVKPDVARLFTT